MGCYKILLVTIVSFLFLVQNTKGWGDDGHVIVCKIAQARLSDAAAKAVKKLLPESANNDLSSKCSWADHVRFIYPWSSALHFANTPDVCSYKTTRDCKDQKTGIKERCIVAAITNYTNQLLHFGSNTKSKYNLTQALYFLSHFLGDIHQPLHCGFLADKGGNSITVHWFTRKQNLHHIWDASILDTEVQRFHDSDMDEFIDALQQNITKVWSKEVEEWESCISNDIACPSI
ncbi:endonuclease 2-like isoform X2 [Trifolium pratense]|nr:endonuclease 2-like isoform X2 [Trifolium pratense]